LAHWTAVLSDVSMVAFALLAACTALRWLRHPSRPVGWLTLAFIILGGLSLSLKIDPALVRHDLVGKGLLTLLALAPYCFFRFVGSFRTPSVLVRTVAALTTAGIIASTFALSHLPAAGSRPAAFDVAYRVAFVLAFGIVSSYVVTKLLGAGRSEPLLAAWRMRLVAVALLGLEVLVGALALHLRGGAVTLATAALSASVGVLFLLTLVLTPLLRVCLGRRDEVAFHQAVDALLSARDSRDVAERLLSQICALVGASQASLTTHDGTVIARYPSWTTGEHHDSDDTGVERRLVVQASSDTPLTLSVRISPYLPYFGTEELHQLDQLAGMMGLGIERCAMAEEVSFQASHDGLTGLANRNLFVERLEEAVQHVGRRRSSLSVMFIDLDRFKLVNDRADHSAGDIVLKEMASRLTTMTRGVDMVARFGGDEFVLFAEVDHEPDAVDMAERIRTGLRAPVALGEAHLSVTASIGLVVTSDDAHTASTLLRDADNAMYEAKRAGRDQISLYRSNARQAANMKWGLSPTRAPRSNAG
jgi:diguanylate cyclase (GGDEF)-like protein